MPLLKYNRNEAVKCLAGNWTLHVLTLTTQTMKVASVQLDSTHKNYYMPDNEGLTGTGNNPKGPQWRKLILRATAHSS